MIQHTQKLKPREKVSGKDGMYKLLFCVFLLI
jgi:hypothetical protein